MDDVLCNGDVFPYQVYRGCLRMDGQTLINLEIFNNNADGGSTGDPQEPFLYIENDNNIVVLYCVFLSLIFLFQEHYSNILIIV